MLTFKPQVRMQVKVKSEPNSKGPRVKSERELEHERNFICKMCDKKGHFTLDCRKNIDSCQRDGCGLSGHTLRNCAIVRFGRT